MQSNKKTAEAELRLYLAEGAKAVRHVREGLVIRDGEHAREAHVLLDDVAQNGEHTDAAVLDLDVPKAVEPLLVGVLQPVERVPVAKRGLHAQLVFERHLHRGRGLRPGGHGGAVKRAENLTKQTKMMSINMLTKCHDNHTTARSSSLKPVVHTRRWWWCGYSS